MYVIHLCRCIYTLCTALIERMSFWEDSHVLHSRCERLPSYGNILTQLFLGWQKVQLDWESTFCVEFENFLFYLIHLNICNFDLKLENKLIYNISNLK